MSELDLNDIPESELRALADKGYVIVTDGLVRVTERGQRYFEAMKLLKDPNLFKKITEEELSKQIVGETDTIKAIFVCAMGSRVENSSLTSYNLLINDESGIGKDHVATKVILILPRPNYVKRTRISPTTLNYWHSVENDPTWTWDGKVLYLEDISNTILNHEVFKVMCSSGSSCTIVVNQVPKDIEVRGKPVMIITTASSTPSNEMLRRFVIVNLDPSIDQTKAIMKMQREASKTGIVLEYDPTITEALSHLRRVRVKIPFADMLDILPNSHVIMRTHNQRFLDLIKASASLHQYQRKIDEEGFILAEGQDYNIAREVLLKLTSNPLMLPLTKDQRKLLEIIKGLDDNSYSVAEIEPHVTFMSDRWLRDQLDKLAGHGFLEKSSKEFEGSDKKVITYRYVGISDIKLPTWLELQNYFNSFNSSNASDGSIPSTTEKQLKELNELNGELGLQTQEVIRTHNKISER